MPPTFMIEELCHRNAAFVIYHADQMPKLEFGTIEKTKLNDEVQSVTVQLKNVRSIPSVAQQAAINRIGLPDILSLEGSGLTVVGGGTLVNEYTNEVIPVERDPARLKLNDGVPGHGEVRVRWYVRGKGKATVKVASQKGGSVTQEITLD